MVLSLLQFSSLSSSVVIRKHENASVAHSRYPQMNVLFGSVRYQTSIISDFRVRRYSLKFIVSSALSSSGKYWTQTQTKGVTFLAFVSFVTVCNTWNRERWVRVLKMQLFTEQDTRKVNCKSPCSLCYVIHDGGCSIGVEYCSNDTFSDGLTSQNTRSVPGKKRTGYRVVSLSSKHDGKKMFTFRCLPFNSNAS